MWLSTDTSGMVDPGVARQCMHSHGVEKSRERSVSSLNADLSAAWWHVHVAVSWRVYADHASACICCHLPHL
jgi:hypothetical protein